MITLRLLAWLERLVEKEVLMIIMGWMGVRVVGAAQQLSARERNIAAETAQSRERECLHI